MCALGTGVQTCARPIYAAKRTRLIVGNAAHDVYQTVPDDASGADRHLSGKQNRRKTTLKNSRRGGLAERAYDHLTQLLVTGTVRDKQWFPTDVLATKLDTRRQRTEERREGKEGVRQSRTRWSTNK